ncbi:MAG: dienelactone hydrolase family protein [Phycisphaerae bacterium]|nr:dienelactone hydrolase family protein [Phycisphaerae bacterium]
MRHRLALSAVISVGFLTSLAAVAPPAVKPAVPPVAPPASGSAAPHALPPEEAGAMKALTGSPRHGEWVTVPLGGPDAGGKVEGLKTWISYPERKDKAPVVIVIHEIFGMTDWVRGVADQLAAEGFIAVAPDLLSGKGPNGGATDSFEGDKVGEAIRTLGADEVVTRLNAAREYAIQLPAATNKVACVGFCWGGTTAWTWATNQPALDGAVVYYGTAPDSKEAIAAITCPVAGFYGGDDARVTSTVERTKTLAAEAAKHFQPNVYEGAGHGFLRQQSGREGKNKIAAQSAWNATIGFLHKALEIGTK